MPQLVSRISEPRETAEDDSPFLSAADLFSLISLSLIYVVIVLSGPALPGTNSVNWVNAAEQISSPVTNNNLTFVMFTPHAEGVHVRLFRGRTKLDEQRLVPLTVTAVADARRWVADCLEEGPAQERVVFHLDQNEERAEAHKFFNELLRKSQEQHPTTQAFRNTE